MVYYCYHFSLVFHFSLQVECFRFVTFGHLALCWAFYQFLNMYLLTCLTYFYLFLEIYCVLSHHLSIIIMVQVFVKDWYGKTHINNTPLYMFCVNKSLKTVMSTVASLSKERNWAKASHPLGQW